MAVFSNLFFRIIKHLLPKSRAYRLFDGKQITKFHEGLTGEPSRVRDEADQVWLDIFPEDTECIALHEEEFGILPSNNVEADRREALDAAWKATGCQSASCMQTLLQAAGFDVYVHAILPVADPSLYLGGEYITTLGEPNGICGELGIVLGKDGGELLVNGDLYIGYTVYSVNCGDAGAIMGEPDLVLGEVLGTVFEKILYPVPTDPDEWPFIFYIGGQTFPNIVTVDAAREAEFKTLVLKLKPTNTWAGLLIKFS